MNFREVGICFVIAILSSAHAGELTINNRDLRVTFKNGELSFYKEDCDTPFLNKGSFGTSTGERIARVDRDNSPVWGDGQALVLSDQSGNTYSVALYKDLPFSVITHTIENKDRIERVISKDHLFAADINLGLGADELITVSTAGLKTVDQSPAGYTYMTVADATTRGGVVCGWLTHERGYGIVSATAEEKRSVLRAHIDYGDLRIPAGQKAAAETLVVGCFADVRDGLELYADSIAKKLEITLPAQPTVYCTWYHGGASDEAKIAANTDFVSEKMKPYQFHVMQIDDKWQDGVRENGPNRNFSRVDPKGPYPNGMTSTASYIKEKGLVPGIWYIPFAGTWNDPFWADKQHLFLKQGKSADNHLRKTAKDQKIDVPSLPEKEWPYVARWGGTCLDVTHPETQEYIRRTADTLANKWGYKYFKMDGLWTGTGTRLQYVNAAYKDDDLGQPTRFNPAITPIEAYAKGLDIIRDTVGDDVFLLGCCQAQNVRSFGPSIGRLDAMRVGPDNGANPASLVKGPEFSSRVYFLNKRVWYNDPDPVYVRNSFPIEMAKTSVSWTGISGSLHSSSYQYTDLPKERYDILLRSIPSHSLLTARPVDFLDSETPRVWHLADLGSTTRKDVIGLFNWDIKNVQQVATPLERMDLPAADRYVGFNFWDNRFVAPFSKEIGATLPPGGCAILSVRPETDHPQIVSTSRHLLQGVVDLKNETWSPAPQTLGGISSVIANDEYELRAVVPVGESWQLKEVVLDNPPAGVTTSFVQSGPTIRIKIISPDSEDIKWNLVFAKASVGVPDCNPVENFTAEFLLDQVVLNWDRDEGFGYRLLRNGEEMAELQGETYADKSVKLGKDYRYEIQSAGWDGRGSEPSVVSVTTPASLTVPPVPPKPQVYCTDLKLKWKTKPKESSGAVQINKSKSKGALEINDALYKNGIGVGAASTLHYIIPGNSKRFVATVGLDSDKKGSVRFKVIGDVMEMGEPAVEIGISPVLKGDQRIWQFDVELDPRFKHLYLVVEDADDGTANDHANWVNAGFIK